MIKELLLETQLDAFFNGLHVATNLGILSYEPWDFGIKDAVELLMRKPFDFLWNSCLMKISDKRV
jgi:hypothetical protein